MNYDVIIIGAGSMGMAAGYYLSKKNKQVLLIDAYDPPHSEGSHHGETRIIRHAYGEGENYVPMALRAQELWLELEQEANKTLFHQTGVLNIGTEDSPFIQNVIKSAEKHALAIEQLSAEEINERWNGYDLPNDLIGCFEPNSGVLMSEACIQAFRDLALQNGSTLLTHTKVKNMTIHQGEVIVTTDSQTIQGKELIITAGKGTNNILSLLGVELPLQPTRKTFSWFHSDEDIYNKNAFPAWSYDVNDRIYYGFPSIDGAGVKVGRHDGGHPTSPEEKLRVFGTYPEDSQDVAHITKKIMSSEMPLKEGKVCTYTNSPDGNFIIDKLKEFPNVTVACGFSGHGFKFSTVVGEILSQMIIDRKSKLDIKQFRVDRFR
ncbi:N-methyl-L-tryptophan oxidase [Paucisalibacillus sp. EB02]|uniref:N-methyl-L-tryptophan oxidase n=1 Tax=Paucisalibacillus sp. EB02 TaxID=1347087 RepID=UPI0004B2F0EB|nr:N-methyl-L-tryptophan oxidase [Paucisalibacillus sp. EB02]